jgi:hypothetical protein
VRALENRKRVIVYGNSLNMAGIAASLKVDACLEVVCVDPHALTTRQSLNELDPTTIIFDLIDPPSDLNFNLLLTQPGLQLIGADVSSDEVLVFSGQRIGVNSGRELAGLVSKHGTRSQR